MKLNLTIINGKCILNAEFEELQSNAFFTSEIFCN
jgi:hypothetical protein